MKLKIDPRTPCPRCGYDLVPVCAVEGSRRRIIALTCPEPYCDHMQMVTRTEAKMLSRSRGKRPAEGGRRVQ